MSMHVLLHLLPSPAHLDELGGLREETVARVDRVLSWDGGAGTRVSSCAGRCGGGGKRVRRRCVCCGQGQGRAAVAAAVTTPFSLAILTTSSTLRYALTAVSAGGSMYDSSAPQRCCE